MQICSLKHLWEVQPELLTVQASLIGPTGIENKSPIRTTLGWTEARSAELKSDDSEPDSVSLSVCLSVCVCVFALACVRVFARFLFGTGLFCSACLFVCLFVCTHGVFAQQLLAKEEELVQVLLTL